MFAYIFNVAYIRAACNRRTASFCFLLLLKEQAGAEKSSNRVL